MKKIFLILGLVAVTGICSAYPSERVSQRVLASFKSEFSSAADVQWETGNNYFRATFSLNEQRIFAFYNLDGELMSVGRYISSTLLPLNLFANLKTDYNGYWITDLFEISNSEGVNYYVTLENADTKMVLHSNNAGVWTSYSKHKKA
jgi:hypothetical protein